MRLVAELEEEHASHTAVLSDKGTESLNPYSSRSSQGSPSPVQTCTAAYTSTISESTLPSFVLANSFMDPTVAAFVPLPDN